MTANRMLALFFYFVIFKNQIVVAYQTAATNIKSLFHNSLKTVINYRLTTQLSNSKLHFFLNPDFESPEKKLSNCESLSIDRFRGFIGCEPLSTVTILKSPSESFLVLEN